MSKVSDPSLPKGWRKVVSDQGVYYYCKKTRETTWDRPTAPAPGYAATEPTAPAASGSGGDAAQAASSAPEGTWRTRDAEVRVMETPEDAQTGAEPRRDDGAAGEPPADAPPLDVDMETGDDGASGGDAVAESEADEAAVEEEAAAEEEEEEEEEEDGDALAIVKRVMDVAAARTAPVDLPAFCAVCRATIDPPCESLCGICTMIRPDGAHDAPRAVVVPLTAAPEWLAAATSTN